MVAGAKKYDIINLESGHLDRRIFVDQAIYDEEMEKIFGRAWLMVAHESLVPNPNDYFLSYMGEDPVIVTRDQNNKLHVMLNMCRHRGNRVLRADDGNAASFMCTYHGWTFGTDGCLNHIPGEQEAYYGAMQKDQMGLIEARVEVYAGLIFACWDKEAPTLEAFLGDARWYLDTTFNRRKNGMIAYGPQKWIEPCNWKTPVDNCSDNYHVPISHFSSASVKAKILGQPMNTMQQALAIENPNHHAFVNGHSLTFKVLEEDAPRASHGYTRENAKDFERWNKESMDEAVERLGPYRAHKIQMGNHSLFPNTVLGFRLALPRGPLKTEFWHFGLVEKDAPEVVKNAIRIGGAQNNGASGLFEQDDIDNWRSVTESAFSTVARKIPADLSMGSGHFGTHDDWPGKVSERYISENNQRHFYMRWMEFMNADSWNDIHLDPISGRYEGNGSFRG
jgi:phenylpropionate dioxygenase-like ring-hydroxylating dioxygenase large terminal subunit